jgi:methyl-accepting chemotaxis protein
MQTTTTTGGKFFMLKRVKMRTKLISSFAGVLLIFIGVALFNLNEVGHIKNNMNDQKDKVDLKVMALELKEMVQELNIIASGLEISKKTEYIEKYNAKRKTFNDMVKRIGDTASTPDQQKWRSQLIQSTVDYISNFDSAAKMIQDKNMKPTDLDTNLLFLYNESQTLKDNIFGLVDKFYVTYAEAADRAIANSTAALDKTSQVMKFASVIVLIITITIAFLLVRSFTRPIAQLQSAVAMIASGDLRHTIDSSSQDELGQLSQGFDHMIMQVRDMLGNTQKIASSLSEHSHSFHAFSQGTASANTEILKAINEISTGADEQAVQSEKSAQIIADLEAEIGQISEYTNLMKKTSSEAAGKTLLGTQSIQSLSEASLKSQLVLHKTGEAMENLAASSNQIGKIVRSITEISTQTNVLALNAAIEAARAGVHGKGFSVIADEVRSLSAQTNDSSKMVGQIVVILQKQIQELQASMQEASQYSQAQNSRVEETLHSFEGIELSMEQITSQIGQIHQKIDQAKQKNEKLVESVHYVAAIAEETAAGVEEVNSTSIHQDASIRRIAEESDDIYSLSQQLFEEISRFLIIDPITKNQTPEA